jgi:hypothetical protein
LLPAEYIAAVCNILAILEKKVVFNISYEVNGTAPINLTSSLDGKSPNVESDFGNLVITRPSTCTLGSSLTSQHCSSSVSDGSYTIGLATSSLPLDSFAAETTDVSQIKPTKTLVKEPDRKEDFSSSATIKNNYDQEKETILLAEVSSVQELPAGVSPIVTVSIYPGEENQTRVQEKLKESIEAQAKIPVHGSGFLKVEVSEELPILTETDQQHQHAGGNEKQSEVMFEEKYQESQDSLSLDLFLSELKDLDMGMDTSSSSAVNPATATTTVVSPPSLAQTQQVQKESVFVRLSNRIKVQI